MKSRKRFDARKHFIRIALAALIMATSLVLTGCGRQVARMEEHQLRLQRLQRLSETNAEQMARSLARLEEDLKKLHVALASVQAGNSRGATNIATAQQGQIKLQETLRQNSQQLSNNIAAVGQDQRRLQGQTELVQSNIQKVASTESAEPRLQMRRWKRQADGAWQLQKVHEQ